MLTVGLVGKRAGAFVAGITSLPETRIVAVCEPDPAQRARLAERAGGLPEAAQFAGYDDLLEVAGGCSGCRRSA
jgi:predicted dehydrogenase